MLKTITVDDFLSVNRLNRGEPIFWDIETEELYYHSSLMQFGNLEGDIYLVAIRNDEDEEKMKQFLTDDLHLVGYNLSYDFGTLDISSDKVDDLFHAVKMAYPEMGEFSLDKVDSALGFRLYADLDKKALQKKGFMRGSYLSQQQLKYAWSDIEVLRRIWKLEKIQNVIANSLAYKLSIYALQEAMIWQQNGLPVLQDKVEAYLKDAKQRETKAMTELKEIVGFELNPRSSKQVKEYFDTTSSDKATLTRIAIEGATDAAERDTKKSKARKAQEFTEEQQRVAELILKARKAKNDISKLESYVGKPKMYGRFKPIGTSTSRWACSGTPKGSSRPELFNAQNYSRDFKSVFGVKPDSGKIIVAADYATLEIRIAAAIMGEENMYKALINGVDIHKATASMLFDKPVEEVHGRERSNAKVANFGLTYGMGLATFINYAYDMYAIKFTEDEARDIIGRFFKAYPGLKKYHNDVGKRLRRGNYIARTALDYPMKPKMYAEAINGPTQGTGGECMRLAIHLMVKKDKRSLEVIINSIHDALYLLVPEEEKEYWSKLLADSMQEAWYEIRKSRHFKWHDIPMPVDVMTGYTMGDLEEDFSGGGQALTLDEIREQKKRNKHE